MLAWLGPGESCLLAGSSHGRERLFSLLRRLQSYLIRSPPLKVKVKSLSHIPLFVTPWTVAYQSLPSMGFSRQEYWSGLPFTSPGDLPNPGIQPWSPALQTLYCLSHQGSP